MSKGSENIIELINSQKDDIIIQLSKKISDKDALIEKLQADITDNGINKNEDETSNDKICELMVIIKELTADKDKAERELLIAHEIIDSLRAELKELNKKSADVKPTQDNTNDTIKISSIDNSYKQPKTVNNREFIRVKKLKYCNPFIIDAFNKRTVFTDISENNTEIEIVKTVDNIEEFNVNKSNIEESEVIHEDIEVSEVIQSDNNDSEVIQSDTKDSEVIQSDTKDSEVIQSDTKDYITINILGEEYNYYVDSRLFTQDNVNDADSTIIEVNDKYRNSLIKAKEFAPLFYIVADKNKKKMLESEDSIKEFIDAFKAHDKLHNNSLINLTIIDLINIENISSRDFKKAITSMSEFDKIGTCSSVKDKILNIICCYLYFVKKTDIEVICQKTGLSRAYIETMMSETVEQFEIAKLSNEKYIIGGVEFIPTIQYIMLYKSLDAYLKLGNTAWK